MFSLIITIISILLVAVLAVATIYYGGSLFTQGTAKAQAAATLSAAQQVVAANTAYELTSFGAPSPDITTLVTGNFLRSIPTLPKSIQSFSMSGKGVVAEVVTEAVCLAITGNAIIAKTQKNSVLPDCFGTTTPYSFTFNTGLPSDGSVVVTEPSLPAPPGLGIKMADGASFTPLAMTKNQKAYCAAGSIEGYVCAGSPQTYFAATMRQPSACAGAFGNCDDETYRFRMGNCVTAYSPDGSEYGECSMSFYSHFWSGTEYLYWTLEHVYEFGVLVSIAPISCPVGSYSAQSSWRDPAYCRTF